MNQGVIPQLSKIILSSAYRRRSVYPRASPVYRVTGRIESKISLKSLQPSEVGRKLEPASYILEKLGYAEWTLLIFEEALHFLFGQCNSYKNAEFLKIHVGKRISDYVDWPLSITMQDPDGDISLSKYFTSRWKIVRARKPIGVDAYLHEIVAELFYHPAVPAGITVERLKEDMGVGRFQAAMAAMQRAVRKLEREGWVILMKKRRNLPGVILTPEGHAMAKRLDKA